MTTTRMNQRHHGEHALAEWRTTNQKKKKKKKEGKEGPLYPFYRPIRGRGRVSESRHAGRGGLVICVQVRDEPISTRLHVSHRVMG